MLLLVPNRETLSDEYGCSTEKQIRWMKFVTEHTFVKEQE